MYNMYLAYLNLIKLINKQLTIKMIDLFGQWRVPVYTLYNNL